MVVRLGSGMEYSTCILIFMYILYIHAELSLSTQFNSAFHLSIIAATSKTR